MTSPDFSPAWQCGGAEVGRNESSQATGQSARKTAAAGAGGIWLRFISECGSSERLVTSDPL